MAAALLWPDADPQRAQASLRQRLHRLRRRLGHALVSDTGAMVLLDDVRHDLEDPSLDAPAADHALLGALDFSDKPEVAETLEMLRDRWAATRLQALEARADALEHRQQFDEALRLAERLLAASPTSEHAHRRCIRLHYLRGDVAQALVSVDRCRERLQALLGLRPGAEIESLATLLSRAASRPVPVSTLSAVAWQRPPRLVGRQQSWALLESACTAGLVVLLRGDAGIGKTRLAHEFCSSRGPLITAKADPADAALPLALLQRLMLEHPAADAVEPVPWRQLAQALQRWAAQPRTTVFIDDLQWADAASLEALLDALALDRPPNLPVLLGVRDGAVPSALQVWLQRLPAGDWLDLPLAPLDEEAVRELLDDLGWPGVPAHRREQMLAVLTQRAAGHPLLLLELLRTRRGGRAVQPSGESVARQLQGMFTRRISRLEPAGQSVLRVAACAGPSFSLPLAAQVLDWPAEVVESAWDSLSREQLLQDDQRLLDAVADAARQAVPTAVAMATHRALAIALAERPESAERVAHHWERAGVWAQAAAAYEQAARAHEPRQGEVLLLWDRCAACHREAGQSAEAVTASWAALEAAAVAEGQAELLARIERHRSWAQQPAAQLRLLLVEARAHLNAGSADGALEPARRARGLAVELADTAAALEAVAWEALAVALKGNVATARGLLDEGRAQAGPAPDPVALQHWRGALGYVLHLAGDNTSACVAMQEVAEGAEAAGRLGDAFEHVANLSTTMAMLGRTAESRAAGARALAIWRKLGEPASLSAAVVQMQLAAVELSDGRFDRALELLNQALQAFRRQGSLSLAALAEHRLAQAWMRLGQPARARQVLTTLPEQADAGRRAMREMLLVRLDNVQGARAFARLRAAQAAGALTASDSRALRLHMAQHAPADEALALVEAVLAEASADGDPPAAAHAHVRAALACVALGRLKAAFDQLRAGWAYGRNNGALDVDQLQFCAWVHEAAKAVGDHGAAEEARATARRWAKGAWPHVPAAWRTGFLRRVRSLGSEIESCDD
jgi:tetratricopeptide (TPR) repeat protein